MSPSPVITLVYPMQSQSFEQVTKLGSPPAAPTSYPLRLETRGDNDEYPVMGPAIPRNELVPDDNLIGAFTYHPGGGVHLEGFLPLYSLTVNVSKDISVPVEISTHGHERYPAVLCGDASISISGFEGLKIIFHYSATTSRPQLQVEDSMQGTVDSHTLAGLSTPVPGRDTLNTILETPAVRSRHIDPSTSPRLRGGSPSLRGIDPIYFPDGSGDEDRTVAPTQEEDPEMMDIGDLDKISATPGMEIPGRQSSEVRSSPRGMSEVLETEGKEYDAPKRSKPFVEVNTGKDTSEYEKFETRDEDMDLDDPKEEEKPDSLPPVFHYHERKKLNTPLKTYGRQGKRNSGGSVKSDTSPNMDSKKRKSPEDRDSPSKRRRADTPTSENTASRELTADVEGIVKPVHAKIHTDPHSPGDEVPFSTAPEESPMPEKKTTKNPSPKAPAKLKAAKNKTPAGETQYDIPSDSDEGADNTPAPESKTPRARRKITPKAAASKTPAASTIKRTKTPRSSKSSPSEPPTVSKHRTKAHYKGPDPRIAFTGASTLAESKSTLSFLKSHSAKTVSSPADPACNFLVINGELKRTPKLVVAVARGLNIVEEAWLVESHASGHFLDPEPYMANDTEREAEWDISLAEAVERGRKGKNKVLEGKTVYLTAGLLQQLKLNKMESGLMEMCEAAGAKNILKKAPRHDPDEEEDEDGIVLAKEDGDAGAQALEKAGWRVYSTSVLGMSVFRGKFVEGGEFRVKHTEGETSPPGKRGGRR